MAGGSLAAPAMILSNLAQAPESPFIFQLPAINGRRAIILFQSPASTETADLGSGTKNHAAMSR